MTTTWIFILFVFGIALLVRTSGWMVSLLTWIARYLKMSEYTAAFILMAAATSIPELFVGINSALTGFPVLSFGNILGANILNVTLVLGVAAIFRAITLEDERIIHGASFIFTLTFTPLIMLLDGVLSRIDGALLILVFFAYLRYLFVISHNLGQAINNIEQTVSTFGEFVKKIFLFIGGVVILLIASRIVVFAAEALAVRFGISAFLVGLVVISLGTTLPELTFSIRSTLSRKGAMSFGNAIGSVVFNLLFILGVVAVIQPIVLQGTKTPVFMSLLTVTGISLLLYITSRIFGRISRLMGIFLVAVYITVALFIFQLSF
ncbi:MAG: sodium:calcium antiporter [bacterium]|nr:sodium:calcium antiporter [bacterium]